MEVRRISDSELQHHGILGMHWGVRRYQNKDGTLTSAGRKRKGIIETYNNKKKMKKLRDAKEAKKAEREEKEKVINSGDAAKVKKIADKLSEEEMAKALTKIQFNSTLDSYINGKNVEKAKKGKSYLETATATLQTVSNLAQAAGNIYSNLDKMGIINKPSAEDKAYTKLKKQSELSKYLYDINSNNVKNDILSSGNKEDIYNLLKIKKKDNDD